LDRSIACDALGNFLFEERGDRIEKIRYPASTVMMAAVSMPKMV